MRIVKNYEPEVMDLPKYPEIDGWDEDIVETAGFIPLEVRFKQMEQAGYRARFLESEFTSKDVSDMFLNHPEFDITDDDDYEDALEKLNLRHVWINKVKEEARSRKAAETDFEASESKAKTSKKESSAEEENS